MAVYTIHDVETGEATNYDRERVTEKLRSLITVKDMTDNIHWKNRTVFAGTDKSVYNVFNICVDYFIEWILATVPSNTTGMGFERFVISASEVYCWEGTPYTKEQLLALIVEQADDWFRMAMDWFNDEYYDYKAPFDLTWDNIFKNDFKHSTYDNEFSDRLLNNYYDYLENNLAYEVENNNIELTDEDTGEITAVKMWQFV